MELLGSPLITMVLNIAATSLVAHGILSEATRDTFVKLVNNSIAAGVTFFVALYSIYKMVDLHKHKLTITSPGGTMVSSAPTSTMLPIAQPVATVTQDALHIPPAPVQPVVETPPAVEPPAPMQQIDQNGLTGTAEVVS